MGAGDWPSVRWIINNTADRAQFIWPFSPCNWLSFKLGVRAESSHGLDTIWSVRATCNYQVPPQSSLTLRGLTTASKWARSLVLYHFPDGVPIDILVEAVCVVRELPVPDSRWSLRVLVQVVGAGRCSSTGSNMCCDCSVAESPSPGTHWQSDYRDSDQLTSLYLITTITLDLTVGLTFSGK